MMAIPYLFFAVLRIAGNPNCGKTTVFNALTGARQHVGQLLTASPLKKRALSAIRGKSWCLSDLHLGTYFALTIRRKKWWPRNVLLSGTVQAVINVVDAGILERGLRRRLREMERTWCWPAILEWTSENAGIEANFTRLSRMMGVSALPTVGTNGKGLHEALDAARGCAWPTPNLTPNPFLSGPPWPERRTRFAHARKHKPFISVTAPCWTRPWPR